jgi:soluble lytic murein transglycosylase-like protein
MVSCDFRMTKLFTILAVFVCALAASAGEARAELVVLTSGRTLSVKGHEIKGEQIVLMLRAGGEITCDRSLVAKILPDEVPYPEPVTEAPAAPATDKQDPDVTGLLQATPYGEIIAAMSEAHGVDPLLVRALIQVESNYKPRARSPKGAMGLMQLMPSTARTYNVRNPFDPKANIEAGIKHLKSLIDRFGVKLGLAAYNAGEGAVQKFNDVPPYRETKSYVSRILALAGVQ